MAILTSACSSSTPEVAPVVVTETTIAETTTSTSADATTTTIDQEAQDRAEIEAVIEGYFDYFYEVGFIDGAPGIEQFATNPILDQIIEGISLAAAAGNVAGEGDYGNRLMALGFDGEAAIATVCVLDQAPLLSATGEKLTPGQPDPIVVDQVLRRTDDGWRVAESTEVEGAPQCDI